MKEKKYGKHEFKTIFNDLCEKKGFDNKSYTQVGKELGVSTQSVLNYLNGDRIPQYDVIKNIKKYFNTSYERLFGEVESDKPEYFELVRKLGLSDKAIDNLIKMHNVSIENGSSNDEYSNWGYDNSNMLVPNLYLFAINKLLEADPKVLFHIGNMLTYPNKDNNFIEKELLSKLNTNELFIPNIELYSFKIAKDLEELQKTIGNTKEVAKFSKSKFNIGNLEVKERNDFKIEYEEIEEIQKEMWNKS